MYLSQHLFLVGLVLITEITLTLEVNLIGHES
jgi:hypothetical protein